MGWRRKEEEEEEKDEKDEKDERKRAKGVGDVHADWPVRLGFEGYRMLTVQTGDLPPQTIDGCPGV